MLIFEILHLLVQEVPFPFALLRLNSTPIAMWSSIDFDPDRGHLRDPTRIVLHATIIGVTASDTERAKNFSGQGSWGVGRLAR
jgi:hypothetical protein